MLKRIFDQSAYIDLKSRALPVRHISVSRFQIEEHGVIIFGAGVHGKYIADSLTAAHIHPVCFVDSAAKDLAATYKNIPIYPPEHLKDIGDSYVLLSGSYANEMILTCEGYGVTNWIFPPAISSFLFIGCELGFTFAEMDAEAGIEECFSLLEDEESRAVFKETINFHCTFDKTLLSYYDKDSYFSASLKGMIDYSHFVDAGAFDGDTLRDWLSHVVKDNKPFSYHAFEPGTSAFHRLSHFIESQPKSIRNAIVAYPKGLGKEEGQMVLSLDDVASTFSLSSHVNNSSDAVSVVSLDSLNLSNVSVIKADVEGFELALLEGAQNTIRKFLPTLIISVYHKRDDFYKIPLYVHELSPQYKLYLRQHAPTYGELVCYAIPR